MKQLRLQSFIQPLNWLAIVLFFANVSTIFFYAPVERTMGNVQRLFYFHVGTAWVGAVAFFVALIAGLVYLRRPSRDWDNISVASVEIGLIFLTMAIVSGAVWGKPAWNTWWLWSPRLTSVTVAWLTYAAYFMLRGAIEDEEKRNRFSAVYVMAAFVTILLSYVSIRILRDIHPVVFGGTLETAQGSSEGLQEFAPGLESMRMGITLLISTISFTVLYIAWMVNRINLQRLTYQANSLKMQVATRLQGGSDLQGGRA